MPATAAEPSRSTDARLRVLIIEDNDIDYDAIGAAVRDRLPRSDIHRIATELEFRSKADFIAAHPPDVIILDVVLRWTFPARGGPPPAAPDGRQRAGVRIWKLLQADQRTQAVPTVVCTYLDIEAFTDQLEEAPANLQIARRKTPDEVAELVVRALTGREGRVEQAVGIPRQVEPAPKRLFVSYARNDRQSMYSIRTCLGALIRSNRLDVWDDTRLSDGDEWERQVIEMIRTADAALFLVSAESLNSPFIWDVEMRYCLKRHDREKIPLLWLLLKPAVYRATPFVRLQSLWDPAQPLDHLSLQQREVALVEVAEKIAVSLGICGFDSVESATQIQETRPSERL